MKKNVASQKVGATLVSATDGSPVTTGTTTVYVTLDAGTQATGSVGSGAATHEGHGYWTYAPSQAETNGDLVAFTFENSSAVNATVQIYTSFPQTGDNYARLGAPAGASVSADIAAVKTDTAAVLLDTGTDGVVVASGSKTGYSLTQSFPTNFSSLSIDTGGSVKVQSGIKKNVALSSFEFLMRDSTNHAPAASLTVSATISKDGGAFASTTNSVTEVANGIYKISLTQTEMNADKVTLRFTATGADDSFVSIVTDP